MRTIAKKKKIPKWLDTLEETHDERVVRFLKKNIKGYNSLLRKAGKLSNRYPVLERLMDSEDGCTLDPEEHKAFRAYKSLHDQIELMERKAFYVMGQSEASFSRWASEQSLPVKRKKPKVLHVKIKKRGRKVTCHWK